jgi:hypothetical protein
MKHTTPRHTPASLSALARGNLHNAAVAMTPGGIEASEAAGQAMLVASEQLPKEMRGATREQLEAIGFKFGADVDDLFVTAHLPPGWKKVASDHSMHSDLVDDKGRVRAGIFYKAAFYDRRANIRFQSRYAENHYGECPDKPELEQVQAEDAGHVIHVFGTYAKGREGWDECDRLAQIARAWLDEKFPQWRDPLAYWSEA